MTLIIETVSLRHNVMIYKIEWLILTGLSLLGVRINDAMSDKNCRIMICTDLENLMKALRWLRKSRYGIFLLTTGCDVAVLTNRTMGQ